MNKRKKKILSVVAVIVLVATVFGIIGTALTIDDGMFSNNTPMKITPNAEVLGSIDVKGDHEEYMFEVTQNGILTVRLDHDNLLDSLKCGFIVTLYKIVDGEARTYREITYFKSFWSDVTSSWGETGVTPGTYLIVVEPGLDILYSDFTVVTLFTPTESYEKELNDTKAEATPVQIGRVYYGSGSQRIENTDSDWFSFEVAEDSCVNITFSHLNHKIPSAGWTIRLYNEFDQLISDFTSKLSDELVKTGSLGLRKGKYYIQVETQTPVVDTYKIQVGADTAVNHEFEINDNPALATDLPMNLAISGSLADKVLSLDKDYYKFTVPADGVVSFEFAHNVLEGDKLGWNVRIIKLEADGTQTEMIKKSSKWNDSGITIPNIGLPAGTYYACIDGDSVSYNSESYFCKWTFTESDNYEKEYNDTFETANNITFNKEYNGAIISKDTEYIFDEDYYKFTLTEETSVALEFSHTRIFESQEAWLFAIVDANGNVIAEEDCYLYEGRDNIDAMTIPAGTYYVRIRGGLQGSEDVYTIKLIK